MPSIEAVLMIRPDRFGSMTRRPSWATPEPEATVKYSRRTGRRHANL
jgi:hypothetical protein